jgi:hypothetical protein
MPFFHARPLELQTITVVAICHKSFDSLAIKEKVSGAHSTEGSAGLIAALDALGKSKNISFPCRKQRGNSSVAQILAQSQNLLRCLGFCNPIRVYNFFGV